MSLPILFSSHSPWWRFHFSVPPTPIRSGYYDVWLDPDAFPLAFEIGLAAFGERKFGMADTNFFVYLSAKDKILLPDATAIY
jgi:hypothetical protein